MDKVQFPAVVVCSRWDHAEDVPVAFVGCDPIHSDAELDRRLAQFRHFEENGSYAYTYTLAALDDAQQVIAERTAELEAVHRFGREQTEAGVSQTPAPAPAPDNGDHRQTQDTTEPAQRQAALVVGYLGAFPPPPETHATGELVEFTMDGQAANAPAHSLAETRIWLQRQGYRPDYTRWRPLDRAVPDGQRRKRLEVYVAEGPAMGVDVKQSSRDSPGTGIPKSRWATPEEMERWQQMGRERFGGKPRAADEPFIPESGQAWRYRHPYSNY